MRFDPYQILGVDRDADVETIKKAYRAKSKETHPDKNGGKDAGFKDVQRAYDILSDPARRKKFDETGDVKETPPISERAIGELARLCVHIVSTFDDVEYVDMIELMVASIRKVITESELQRQACQKRAQKYRIAASKFKVKTDRMNVFQQILVNKAEDNEKAQVAIDDEIAIAQEALRILGEFEYIATEREPVFSHYGSPFMGDLNELRKRLGIKIDTMG